MMRALVTGLALLAALASPAAAAFFSDGYRPPASKQGVSEFRMSMSAEDLAARTARLKRLGTGYIQYNVFWSALESADVPSGTAPVACPAGHVTVPKDAAEKARLGYHRYRCIDLGQLAQFDALMRRDQANGIQSGVALWSAAPRYRHPGCVGSPGAVGKQACVPRDDALDDFEDYVNLVASRYNGGAEGKVSHFILWNENASPIWFDTTPTIPPNDRSSGAIEARIDKLAEMMKRAHAALQRHQRQALLYASTDMLWDPWLHPGHYGTRRLIDGLWARLGTRYSWSLAVHPYQDVDRPPARGTYSFANLEVVTNYQRAKLAERGLDDLFAPQMWIIASEQGWGLREKGREGQARQICLAHDRAMQIPELVAVAHNYFQSIEPHEADAAGESTQGSFLGLLPYTLPNSLAGMERVPTGQALAATMNRRVWRVDPDNYCCRNANVGCPIR